MQSNTTVFYLRSSTVTHTVSIVVHELNQVVIAFLPGEMRSYTSRDIANSKDGAEEQYNIPLGSLHGITTGSLPPHSLNLKVGCPIIMLRNINPAIGLCNGTRLVVVAMHTYCIKARILGGQ